MGHGNAGSKESHQPDADRQSRQEDHGRRGTQASLDLRECYSRTLLVCR